MFGKVSAFAALVPLAVALSLQTPSNVQAGEPLTISWTSASGDPTSFTIELVNGPVLLNAIAIANNVQTTTGSVSLVVPIVPADGSYTIQAVNIGNISNVFDETGSFAIAAAPTTAPTSTVISTAAVSAPINTAASSLALTSASTPLGITTPLSSASSAGAGLSSGLATGSSPTAAATSPPASTSPSGAAPAIHAPAGLFAAGAMGIVAIVAGLAL